MKGERNEHGRDAGPGPDGPAALEPVAHVGDLALGVTWVLDGIEVSIASNIADALTDPATGLGFSAGQVGAATGIYIAGACTGALFFSYLTDRFGRRRLFLVTLAVYLIFSVLTAFSWDFFSFALFRFLAGMGIGGEYSAIYSAIDELIPARVHPRGCAASWPSSSAAPTGAGRWWQAC